MFNRIRLGVCQWQITASLTILWIFSPKLFLFSQARPLETYLRNEPNYTQYSFFHVILGWFILIKQFVLDPVQTILFAWENMCLYLYPEARAKNEDLSCSLQRLRDPWDSQQPHGLVLLTYCNRTEFPVCCFQVVGACVTCWMVEF